MFTHPRISTSPHPPDSYQRGSLRIDDSFSPNFPAWDNQPRNPPNFLSMSESDFPALGQRKAETFAPLSRAPNSPSQPSRPHSMSDHNQGPGVLEFPLESPFPPQLSLPTHRAYVGSLSTKNDERPSEFQLDKNDFPTLDRGAPAADLRNKLPGSSALDDDTNRGTFETTPFDSRMPGLVPGLSVEKDTKADERYRNLVNQRPAVNSLSSIQYDPNTQTLSNVPSSMLADKHSFLGCTKILREVLGDKQQARSLQAFDLDKEWIRIGQSRLLDASETCNS